MASQYGGPFTELQVEQCAAPLWAAMAARWHVDDMTVATSLAAYFMWSWSTTGDTNWCSDVADMDTFIQHTAAAVRASSQNARVRIGAGGLISDAAGACPSARISGATGYTNLMPAGVLDFAGIDMYPVTSVPAANYNNTLATYAAMAQHIVRRRQTGGRQRGERHALGRTRPARAASRAPTGAARPPSG